MKKKLFFGLLFCALAAAGFTQESEEIFSYRLGRFEIYMLVEAQREGNAGILVGVDQALLSRYIPANGFNHSTNVFLIKAPGRNILIDTGFGTTIFDKMKKLGVEPDQIDAVLLTHLHGDHIGGLQKDGKALFPKAKIYLSAPEMEYWTKTNVSQGIVAALASYDSRIEVFEPGTLGSVFLREILSGITPIAAYGHTPGHTVFLLESGGAKLLIIADLLHVALVQFPVPEISATYDLDQKAAAEARRQVLDYAAKNKIPVGGMHMVYPGMGSVEAAGEGFSFIPVK